MFSLRLNVVKIGGSLFDHPALGEGLRRWTASRPESRLLFVPGGGALADAIRDYHRIHRVSQEQCHWMAIRAMGVNTSLIKSMMPDACEIEHPGQWPGTARVGVLNAHQFALDDESQSGALPHDWRVTSDAIAARVAEIGNAAPLIMLKSVDLPAGISWPEAAGRGLVDSMFGEVIERTGLSVEWVNFRALLEFSANRAP